MKKNSGCRFRVGSVALLAMTGTLTLVGTSLGSVPAGADTNLIQNGSFETVSGASPTSYLPVPAGDTSTISGWTVVTPAMYTPGEGSVDVVGAQYNNWGAENGQYSIDMAGTSAQPGGIYQNVATTPGAGYSLTFYSSVNGDQTQGINHTMGVKVGTAAQGTSSPSVYSTPPTPSAGTPLAWTLNTVNFTATSTSTHIEFDDTTVGDTTQGPTLDNVSLTKVADAVTTCTGSGCSGTVTTPSQTVQISSTSTTGTISTTVNSSTISCGDPFRHAPQIVTVSDTGLNANIVYTVTFPNKSVPGSWLTPFAVCYQAETPFTDLYGRTVTTGLLPLCTLFPRPNKPLVAPCVQSIIDLPLYIGNVVEKIVLPPGDPKFH